MRKNRLYRPFMMIAGVLAAVVILFSQSFYHQAQSNIQSNSKKIATEQSSDKDADKAFITTPSDAVVNSSVENENVQIPSLLEELFTTDEEAQSVSIAPAVFANLFKTFFRAVISPNAP